MKQLTEVRLRVKRLKSHPAHEAAYSLTVYLLMLGVPNIIRHLAVSPRWMLKMQFIKPPHQFKILLALPMRQISFLRSLPSIRMEAVNTTSVDLQQLTLALNAYSLIVNFYKTDSLLVS